MRHEGSFYEVIEYSTNALIEKLVQYGYEFSDKQDVENKSQTQYFKEYFDAIKPKTIIVETNFIDANYLDDFASFHVKCFANYKKTTTRFFFFAEQLSSAEFDTLLREGASKQPAIKEKIRTSYIGNIVVRPLPRREFGKTILKTYKDIPLNDPASHERRYPVGTICKSNLCGIPLEVNSVPFQEQDSSVSACATSAVWSVLSTTASLFNHPVLSPYTITQVATDGISGTDWAARDFPNQGLTAGQILQALKHVNLEPHSISLNDRLGGEKKSLFQEMSLFKEYIYSYLECGIPLILGIKLCKTQQSEISNNSIGWTNVGCHAVVVTGMV